MPQCPICQTEYIEGQVECCPSCGWELTSDALTFGPIPKAFLEKERMRVAWAKEKWERLQVQHKQFKPQKLVGQWPQEQFQGIVTELIVCARGQSQYTTIGEAVRDAKPGTRILVRPGLYREGIVIDKLLEICGDGPTASIVVESPDSSCIAMGTDFASVHGLSLSCKVSREEPGIEKLPVDAKYCAVDISQGQLFVEDCDIISDSTACVAIHGSVANPIIRHCRIYDGRGAGILVSQNGQGMIESCDIFNNAAAGIEIRQQSNPTIRHCQIHDGQNNGISIAENSQGTVEDCDIFNNVAVGIKISQQSDPNIRHCQIHDGQNNGILIAENSQGTVEDCDIFNHALAEVKIVQNSNPNIRECHIHNGKGLGVLISDRGRGKLDNCHIFTNTLSGVAITQGSDPTIRECRIRDGHQYGVLIYNDGKGKVVDCDISGNALNPQILTWNCLHNLRGHSGLFYAGVKSVAFSPDGQILASGSSDHTIKLWQVTTGQEICYFSGHANNVCEVTFSPDRKMLATGSDDWSIRIWQTSS